MNLEKLGLEMRQPGTQVLLHVDPDSGAFLADLMRGNDSVICKPHACLTEALRALLPEGSVDKVYCGWRVEDVQALEPILSLAEAREVLELMEADGDATIGFSWDTLEAAITKFRKLLASRA